MDLANIMSGNMDDFMDKSIESKVVAEYCKTNLSESVATSTSTSAKKVKAKNHSKTPAMKSMQEMAIDKL
eukprot:9788114-Ditylum_brightwellii.AAC.1